MQQHNRRDCFVQTDPNVQILKQPVMSMKDYRLLMRAKGLAVIDKKQLAQCQANLVKSPSMGISAKEVVKQFQQLANLGTLYYPLIRILGGISHDSKSLLNNSHSFASSNEEDASILFGSGDSTENTAGTARAITEENAPVSETQKISREEVHCPNLNPQSDQSMPLPTKDEETSMRNSGTHPLKERDENTTFDFDETLNEAKPRQCK